MRLLKKYIFLIFLTFVLPSLLLQDVKELLGCFVKIEGRDKDYRLWHYLNVLLEGVCIYMCVCVYSGPAISLNSAICFSCTVFTT